MKKYDKKSIKMVIDYIDYMKQQEGKRDSRDPLKEENIEFLNNKRQIKELELAVAELQDKVEKL